MPITYIYACYYRSYDLHFGASTWQRRRQADKSELMRRKLIDATIEALVDVGYSKTTAVEICRRAEVTRDDARWRGAAT